MADYQPWLGPHRGYELSVTTARSPGRRRLRWKQPKGCHKEQEEEEKGALPAELATKLKRQLATPSAMRLVVAHQRQALPEVVERDSVISPADAELELGALEDPEPTVSQLEAELEQMLNTPPPPPADDTDDDDDAESEDSNITLKWGLPLKVPRLASTRATKGGAPSRPGGRSSRRPRRAAAQEPQGDPSASREAGTF